MNEPWESEEQKLLDFIDDLGDRMVRYGMTVMVVPISTGVLQLSRPESVVFSSSPQLPGEMSEEQLKIAAQERAKKREKTLFHSARS